MEKEKIVINLEDLISTLEKKVEGKEKSEEKILLIEALKEQIQLITSTLNKQVSIIENQESYKEKLLDYKEQVKRINSTYDKEHNTKSIIGEFLSGVFLAIYQHVWIYKFIAPVMFILFFLVTLSVLINGGFNSETLIPISISGLLTIFTGLFSYQMLLKKKDVALNNLFNNITSWFKKQKFIEKNINLVTLETQVFNELSSNDDDFNLYIVSLLETLPSEIAKGMNYETNAEEKTKLIRENLKTITEDYEKYKSLKKDKLKNEQLLKFLQTKLDSVSKK